MKLYINPDGKIACMVAGAISPKPKDTTEIEVPRHKIPEHESLDQLKWDGKKVVLDPNWKPPEARPDSMAVLAKKAMGETLTTEEEAVLKDLAER